MRSQNRRRHQSPPLGGESLEPRVVLSATVEFDAARRLLEITGTAADDAVEIRQQGRDLAVTIDGTVAEIRAIRGVRGIVFTGLAGDDSIVNTSRLRLVADGGEGDDILQGGFRGDRLVGGPGNDTLRGERGNDVLNGGSDDDSIYGGPGRDRLQGDDGDDRLDGGEGRDFNHGGAGLDIEDDFNDRFRDGDRDRDGYDDDHDRPIDAGLLRPVTFDAGGQARIAGTSRFDDDRQFYSFTAPVSGILTVAIAPGDNGRYAELELKDLGTRRELLELEPHERPWQTSGRVAVTAGRTYVLKLESPFDRSAVDFTVDLALA